MSDKKTCIAATSSDKEGCYDIHIDEDTITLNPEGLQDLRNVVDLLLEEEKG